MRISDWSSDVCSSDLEMADEMDLQAADYRQLVDETQAVRHESLDEDYSDQSMWFADVEDRADEALERENPKAAIAAGIRTLPDREAIDRQSVVEGKGGTVRVVLGGSRMITTKKNKNKQ